MRLQEVLRTLSAERLEALKRRHGVEIDPKKRLDEIEQIARALSSPGTLLAYDEWPESTRAAAQRLAAHPEGVPRLELGGAGLKLVESHIAFAIEGDRLIMPSVYRAQIPRSPMDPPRAVRHLLGQLDEDSLYTVTSAALSRIPSAPRPLLLGELLEALEPRDKIEEALADLGPRERALVASIEARGSELDTAEILELTKDPARYQTAGGSVLPRRSPAFALMRKGLLFPVGDGVYVLPVEVEEVVGRERRAAYASAREAFFSRANDEDRTPPRGELAQDASPTIVALLCTLAADGVRLAEGAPVPRTTLARAAEASFVSREAAEMLMSLSRAEGLAGSSRPAAEASALVLRAYARTNAWDEARDPEDAHRALDRVARIGTPTAVMHGIALDVLASLPKGRFVEAGELARAILGDLRASSAERILARARGRAPASFPRTLPEIVERVVRDSLPALSAVDRGLDEGAEVLRLSSRARGALEGRGPGDHEASEWSSGGRAVISLGLSIREIVAAAPSFDAYPSAGRLFAEVTEDTLARAVSAGASAELIEARLTRLVGPLPPEVARALESATRNRPRCVLSSASAYVEVPDAKLRSALLADPDAKDLFSSSSPPSGVLVRPAVSLGRVRRLIARLGGQLEESREGSGEEP